MEIQIRDSRDPFTQALAFLFRNKENAPALRRRLREEMIPLVTQVAIKIGGIDTEKSVRDRALAMFTGMISCHLSHMSVDRQGEVIAFWAEMIKSSDLKLLFRKGYTLIDELRVIAENQLSFGDWLANIRHRSLIDSFSTRIEHMERYTTSFDETGLWIGYLELNGLIQMKERFEYSLWLVRQAKAEKEVVENRSIYFEPETIVNRVALNILLSGKVSLAMDYRRVVRIIDYSYGKKRWLEEAKKRYEKFLSIVPSRFHESLFNIDRNLRRSSGLFWEKVEGWPKKELSRRDSIDDLCLGVAITPPGLKKKMFDADRHPLKDYEV